MAEMTYDSKCAELAEHFLSDLKLDPMLRANLTVKLARDIQRTVEDFMQEFDEATNG